MNSEDVLAMHKIRMKNGLLQKRTPIYTEKNVQKALDNNQWINGEGDFVYIPDMSVDHINNVIRFLLSGTYTEKSLHKISLPKELAKAKSQYLSLFEIEMNSRGKS